MIPNLVDRSVIVGTALLCVSCVAPPDEQRIFRSPTGAYEVVLRGGFRRPRLFLVETRVTGAVSRYGRPYSELGTVFSADSRDEDFATLFPSATWLNENTLALTAQTSTSSDDACDLVTVTNNSRNIVRSLTVTGLDLIVALDLPSGATREWLQTGDAGDDVFIRVEADLGRRVDGSSTVTPAQHDRANHVSIRLNDRSVDITLEQTPRPLGNGRLNSCLSKRDTRAKPAM